MKDKSFHIIVFLIFSSFTFIHAQDSEDVLNKINAAIKQSDATKLALYFNTTIDLEIGTTDGTYSSKQAEMIMKNFFKDNTVKSYASNHTGSSDDGSKYMIGTYKSTNAKSYRVYILLKKIDTTLKINQLQFEDE